tara:strand:- start:12 stop:155 length:144 start_codon:yes stop_codon:yes gene_type:complete
MRFVTQPSVAPENWNSDRGGLGDGGGLGGSGGDAGGGGLGGSEVAVT